MYDKLDFLGITADIASLQNQDEIVEAPFTYLKEIPTSDYLTRTCRALGDWLKVPAEKLDLIDKIQEIFLTSFNLIDDIEDNSILRRNVPVAHSIYGIPRTLNASVYGYFKAAEEIHKLSNPDAYKIYAEEMINISRAQGIEIYWRESFTIPKESEYKVVALQKIAGFFLFSIRCMQLFSENKKDLSKLVYMIALYAQILDDLCDVDKDITEGKFSFPIVHAIHSLDNNHQLVHILKRRSHDAEVKKYFISILERCGSIQYTNGTLKTLENKIREEAAMLGLNSGMEELFNEIFPSKKPFE